LFLLLFLSLAGEIKLLKNIMSASATQGGHKKQKKKKKKKKTTKPQDENIMACPIP